MEIRGPVEILGAIVDEVEGLRRTDTKSHLPEFLLREARAALDENTASASGAQLSAIDGLIGRTVSHVFEDGLNRAQVVIVCTDGSFIALECDGDADDGFIKVDTLRSYSEKSGLPAYLSPSGLVEVGLMTEAERKKLEHDEKLKAIEQAKKRAESQMERLRAELAQLEKSL